MTDSERTREIECPCCVRHAPEIARLRARVDELERTEGLAFDSAVDYAEASKADWKARAEKAERRVEELELAILDVRKQFRAFPGDDDESDLFWYSIKALFAALDAAREGE